MPEPFSLDATHVRLLRWLYHYPFQRLEDLVVALSTWSRRTTIYTHVRELERMQLVEILTVRAYPGTYLYHLAPSGFLWCLEHQENVEQGSSELNASTMRECLAEERAALMRLLPRLPVWLTLQTAINSLVSGAASALTQQGHRANLIRWNWRRDALHRFTSSGHSMQWFAESIGAFCLRFGAGEETPQEYWYRFFLLSTPLTHPRLMRARLDRLLRWRESQERWQAYTQMPPILILTTTARQAEWWHEAAERVTHDLGVKRPLGAVVSLIEKSQPQEAFLTADSLCPLWQLPWKHLGTERACHLQEIFLPQDDPGFPDLFPQEARAPLRAGAPISLTAERKLPHRHLYRFAALAQRQHKKCEAKKGSQRNWRLLSLMLSPRQWEILALLLAHPLLDRADFCTHLRLARSSLRHLLPPLERAYLITNHATATGERFSLAENGLRLMAAVFHCQVRHLVHRPGAEETATGKTEKIRDSLIQRGVPGFLKQIDHLAGVYGFGAMLTQIECLRWWETGGLCAHLYQYQGNWHGIRPDMVAECRTLEGGEGQEYQGIVRRERSWRFFLEWDRGTMHERDLRRKLTSYALYYTSREWSREHRVPPALLFVVPDIGQEQLLTRLALIKLRDCPTRVTLYTTTRGLLATAGLAAAIWRQALPRAPDRQGEAFLPRLALFFPGSPGQKE